MTITPGAFGEEIFGRGPRGQRLGSRRVTPPGMTPFADGNGGPGMPNILDQELQEIKERMMGRFSGRMGERQAAFDDREAERRGMFEAMAAGRPDFENRMARYETRAENRAARFGERMENREKRFGEQLPARAENRARMRSARDMARRFRASRGGSTAPGVTGAATGGMAPTPEAA